MATAYSSDPRGDAPADCDSDPPLFRCAHSLRDCERVYLDDAARLGLVLHESERDFGVFDSSHLLEKLKSDPKPGCRFKFMEGRGRGSLTVPQSSWSSPKKPSASSRGVRSVEAQRAEGVEVKDSQGFKKKPRANRGVEAQHDEGVEVEGAEGTGKKPRANRGRGGQDKRTHRGSGGGQDKEARHDLSLLKRAFDRGQFCLADAFCLRKDGSRTTTGWHGVNPPPLARQEIRRLFFNGEIKKHLAHFYPVAYVPGSPALIVDCEDRLFAYRTTPAEWLRSLSDEFLGAVLTLITPNLKARATQQDCKGNDRGDHFPCIFGLCRQYTETPDITAWHKQHEEDVDAFLASDVIKRVIKWASKLVEMFFPGVAARFQECADWHQKHHGKSPQFGLFFNLCINGMFPDQSRIFCAPHADFKNVVGVCALLIYQLQKANFNHTQRSWIVLWEAGVIIELPPWVILLYPSSLLYHFNIDVHDIQFVTTNGERPTRENSCPIQKDDERGRGSLVFFNQASMYQASETGHGSLKAARAAGLSGTTDFQSDVQYAFSKYCRMVDLKTAQNNLEKKQRK